jgi:hypothetical protein
MVSHAYRRGVIAGSGVAVGYYGLDFFARPIEIKALRRTHLAPAPQIA